MATIDNIEIPSLLLAEQGSAPTTPASGFGRLYAKSTGLFFKGDDGVEIGPFATTGGTTAVGCRLTKSANQSIGSSATAAVTFDGEAFDTNTFHDNATNNSRITIPSGMGGQYMVGGGVQWNEGATGAFLMLRVNGTTTIPCSDRATEESHAVNSLLNLVAGDYVELVVQNLVAAIRTVRGGSSNHVDASFWATRIGS